MSELNRKNETAENAALPEAPPKEESIPSMVRKHGDTAAAETRNETPGGRSAMKVSVDTMAANFILTAVKLTAGIIGHSGAMISDAIHSASDVVSTIIVMVGIKVSQRGADPEHPYGHDRMECIAAMILSGLLAVTGLKIGLEGVQLITTGAYLTRDLPGKMALYAAVLSIAVKEAMFWYTRHYAKKLNSTALMADAWHHRSDALSSIGAFIGIFAARLGYPITEPLASVVICIFILKASFDIFRDSVDRMVDKACSPETDEAFKKFIESQDGVLGIDLLRTREFGSKIYMDLEIRADGNLSLREAHKIAQRVHDGVEEQFPRVKHIMIHINPND